MTPLEQNNQDIDKIINDIMEANGFRYYYQVAQYFDVSAQTLSGWVKQKKIPPKHFLKYYSDFNLEEPGQPEAFSPDISESNKNGFVSSRPKKISLKKIYRLLYRNKNIIMGFPVTISLITIVYLFFIAKPIYKTSAVILPTEGTGQNMSGLLGAATQMGMSMPFSMDNEIAWDEIYPEIVGSERLKRIVLQDTFSTHKYGAGIQLQSIIANELDILNKPFHEQQQESSKHLDELIHVNKTRFSSIVNLDVYGFEPEFTAALANRIIDHSGKLQRQYKTNQVNQKRQFLDDRISVIENEVKTVETNLRIFREQNRHYNKSPSLILQEERLNQELVLQRSLLVTLKSQFEKAKIEEVEKSAMIQVIDEPFIPWEHDSPKRGIILVIATFFGFFGAVILVYAKEYIFEMD